MMTVFKAKETLVLILSVFLAVLVLWGCTTINYSFDPKTNLSGLKAYTWAASQATYGKDPLVEANVEALADQLLAQKGFTRMSEHTDLAISISYELDSSLHQVSYQLKMLTLNIYQIERNTLPSAGTPNMHVQKGTQGENRQLIWRGTAFGTINTDAASADLGQAVQGILLHFPPK